MTMNLTDAIYALEDEKAQAGLTTAEEYMAYVRPLFQKVREGILGQSVPSKDRMSTAHAFLGLPLIYIQLARKLKVNVQEYAGEIIANRQAAMDIIKNKSETADFKKFIMLHLFTSHTNVPLYEAGVYAATMRAEQEALIEAVNGDPEIRKETALNLVWRLTSLDDPNYSLINDTTIEKDRPVIVAGALSAFIKFKAEAPPKDQKSYDIMIENILSMDFVVENASAKHLQKLGYLSLQGKTRRQVKEEAHIAKLFFSNGKNMTQKEAYIKKVEAFLTANDVKLQELNGAANRLETLPLLTANVLDSKVVNDLKKYLQGPNTPA